MNGESNNQEVMNVPNKYADKGKTSTSIKDNKVNMTPLCFKCDGHGHYVVVCSNKCLHFCIEEPEFELESYLMVKILAMKMNLMKNVVTMMV